MGGWSDGKDVGSMVACSKTSAVRAKVRSVDAAAFTAAVKRTPRAAAALASADSIAHGPLESSGK